MDSIELKDLISRFTSSPIETMGYTFQLITSNFWENKWRILVLLLAVYLIRWGIFKLISSMVPSNEGNARVGHILRKIFLRKVTDPEGRLRRRTSHWFKQKKDLSIPQDKYNQIKDKAYYSRRSERAAGAASLMKSFLNFLIVFFAGVILLSQLGITIGSQTGGWILGFLSIALALGVQNIVKDVIGGIHVLVEDQYGLGDYIDAQLGVAGVVTHIGLRTTRLKGTDGTIYHIRHSEMPKIGNKTQATGTLVVDMELTWNDPKYDEIPMLQIGDYEFAERTLLRTIQELRSTLYAVERVKLNQPSPSQHSVPITRVAQIVPDLVPTLTDETLTNLQVIATKEGHDEAHEHYAHAQVSAALQRVEKKTKPIFTTIEMLGLVSSEAKSITLRVKVNLDTQGSTSKALSVLRNQVFKEFSKHNISVKFEEVPEGRLL